MHTHRGTDQSTTVTWSKMQERPKQCPKKGDVGHVGTVRNGFLQDVTIELGHEGRIGSGQEPKKGVWGGGTPGRKVLGTLRL